MSIRFLKSVGVAAALAILLAACQTAQAPEPEPEPTSTAFYAITRSTETTPSNLWYMDEFGVAELVGSTGVRLQYIKFNPVDGLLYGVSVPEQLGSCTSSTNLVTLDVESGAVVDTVTLSTLGVRAGLTFLSDGTAVVFNNCWDGSAYNFETVDLETGTVTIVAASDIGWYSYGMWTDADDTVWFINGNANVYEIDVAGGTVDLVHEGDTWVPDYSDVVRVGDFHLRGDLNPDTGDVWGVSPAYGYAIASAVVRATITADTAELLDVAPVQSAISIHALAFPR
ncbi:MAG: hypothetical protein EA416_00925 [Trueperaceae bacterium]|jgi:hypothetical protein|nr:MAG: hypothetical protein EA416_00925 [Trueperaceae bacterium]